MQIEVIRQQREKYKQSRKETKLKFQKRDTGLLRFRLQKLKEVKSLTIKCTYLDAPFTKTFSFPEMDDILLQNNVSLLPPPPPDKPSFPTFTEEESKVVDRYLNYVESFHQWKLKYASINEEPQDNQQQLDTLFQHVMNRKRKRSKDDHEEEEPSDSSSYEESAEETDEEIAEPKQTDDSPSTTII
jgi:hypothetical protein